MTPEVQIAQICGDTIEDVKLIEEASQINQVDLLYRVSKDVEQSSIEAGVPMQSQKIKEMVKSIPESNKRMGEAEEHQIYADLDTFIKFAGEDKLEGVYEYIGTDELER